MKAVAVLVLLVSILSSRARAVETEQFTLPTHEIADIGQSLSEWVHQALVKVVAESQVKDSEEDLMTALLRELGHCRFGFAKFNTSKFAGFCISRYLEKEYLPSLHSRDPTFFLPVPSIYTKESAPGFLGSIIADGAFDNSLIWRGFAPTAKIFGVMVGLDKIGHLLKLGRDYFLEWKKQIKNGVAPQEADHLAIYNVGVWFELNYYGKKMSGIYSNADLATNLSGLKFYQRLFFGLVMYGQTLVPLVTKSQAGRWVLNVDVAPQDILRPFISDHMNEALNPNWFTDKHAPLIKAEIAKRCDSWSAAYPERIAEDYNLIAERLKLWNGIDYGHRDQPDGAFTIGHICY